MIELETEKANTHLHLMTLEELEKYISQCNSYEWLSMTGIEGKFASKDPIDFSKIALIENALIFWMCLDLIKELRDKIENVMTTMDGADWFQLERYEQELEILQKKIRKKQRNIIFKNIDY